MPHSWSVKGSVFDACLRHISFLRGSVHESWAFRWNYPFNLACVNLVEILAEASRNPCRFSCFGSITLMTYVHFIVCCKFSCFGSSTSFCYLLEIVSYGQEECWPLSLPRVIVYYGSILCFFIQHYISFVFAYLLFLCNVDMFCECSFKWTCMCLNFFGSF